MGLFDAISGFLGDNVSSAAQDALGQADGVNGAVDGIQDAVPIDGLDGQIDGLQEQGNGLVDGLTNGIGDIFGGEK